MSVDTFARFALLRSGGMVIDPLCQCGIPTDPAGAPFVCAAHRAPVNRAALAPWLPIWQVDAPPIDPAFFVDAQCPGCGLGCLTAAANPMHPHNPVECAAWKRGYEAGLAAAARAAG